MKEYLEALAEVKNTGELRTDRTGTGTMSLFGKQIVVNADPANFPLLTTKRMYTTAIVGELLWFLSGSTNINDLKKYGNITIWDEWADHNGDLGPIYGKQWRKWEPNHDDSATTIDQLGDVIAEIKCKPDSRHLIVSAWNVADLGDMKLLPCHVLFQFYVRDLICKHGDKPLLDLQLYQRSADIFLGVPFNISSYALLLNMIAQVVDMRPGRLITTYGDLHLYQNHLEPAFEQLSREPRKLPSLWLNPNIRDIDKFTTSDIRFCDYNPHGAIKAPVAV